MSHSILTNIFSSVCPWLALVCALQFLARRCRLGKRGALRLAILSLLSAVILAIRLKGIPMAAWVRGLNANFSIPLAGVLAVTVWEAEFPSLLRSGRDWLAAWVFGAASGLVLYPLALGWGRFDPYGWGWGFSPLFAAVALLTVLLIWRQNRFGVLLVLATVAYHLGLLESDNYWDYLLDPIYWVLSLAALAVKLGQGLRLFAKVPR